MIFSWLRILAGTVFVALVLTAFLPLLLLFLPSRRIRIRLGNASGKIIGRTVLFLASATVDDTLPKRAETFKPAIFISNHTSILDIFIGIWIAPYGTCGVAKKSVVWYPFFGLLYLLAGHLRIDRANREQAVGAMADTAALMKRHDIGLWIWPEGTRARDGRFRRLKKGFAHMALATGLPIVPVVVAGAHKAWRHGSWKIHPTNLQITVLDPISTQDWTPENLDAKIRMVHDLMENVLPEEQRGVLEQNLEDWVEPSLLEEAGRVAQAARTAVEQAVEKTGMSVD